MSLIKKIMDDDYSSQLTSINFNSMIQKDYYFNYDVKSVEMISKLLGKHMINDLAFMVKDFLNPREVLTYKQKSFDIDDYQEFNTNIKQFEGLAFSDIILRKESIDNNKLNGITFGFSVSTPSRKLPIQNINGINYQVRYTAYYKDNLLHRDNGSALEFNGDKYWFQEGQIHRYLGPAIIYRDSEKQWYSKGKKHRIGGPAEEWFNGNKFWFQEGKLHRVGAPAVEYISGTKEWRQHDKLHREDGPAVIRSDRSVEWRLNDILFEGKNSHGRYLEKLRKDNLIY